MATISDTSIMSMAQDIVTDFVDGKTTLNDGVIKKANEMALNTDQTQRLIERTNTEAFLRKFPETSEFEVASPEVVLGIKTAKVASSNINASSNNEGLFKAASEHTNYIEPASVKHWKEKLASISDEELFGIDEEFKKEASQAHIPNAIDVESREMLKALAETRKTASEITRQNAEREIAFGEKIEDLADYIKQASLSDRQSIHDSEYELLKAFPDNRELVRSLYDTITEKLASEKVMPIKLARSETPEPVRLYTETELTKKFQEIVDILTN